MTGNLTLHPTFEAQLAHNARVLVVRGLMDRIGDEFTPEQVAAILGDAFGDALAICALQGAGQSKIDNINKRSVDTYWARLAPFIQRAGE